MDNENKFASCLGWVVAWLALLVVGTVMNGWALSTIWNWFIPPIFFLTTLSIMQAIGVSIVFSLFTGTNKLSSKKDSDNKTSLEKFVEAALQAVLVPIAYVVTAYVVLQFAF